MAVHRGRRRTALLDRCGNPEMSKPNPLFDLTGQVAVVTGSTNGIGRSTAEGLAGAGGGVAKSSRKPDACASVAEQITAEGLNAVPIPCHVGKREDVERLVSETIRRLGKIDTLVCNAAV